MNKTNSNMRESYQLGFSIKRDTREMDDEPVVRDRGERCNREVENRVDKALVFCCTSLSGHGHQIRIEIVIDNLHAPL